MKLLVTGVTGFVGTHLVELLLRERPDVEIHGLVRRGVERVSLPERVKKVEAEIVHQPWLDPDGTLRTNLHGTLHVLEALRKRGLTPPMLVVGSADEYGEAEAAGLPLREDCPLRPSSPYAVSKVAQGYLALQYALSYKLPVLRTRTFPHTGPGRGEGFAESSFAKQLAEIELGRRAPVLEVGNLDAVRDFTDVRDVVRAYWLLLEKGAPGEVYNVCSGRGVAIRELLERLIGMTRAKVEVRIDPARLRPSDVPVLVGDPERLQKATGWRPCLPIERTLQDLLDHWRGRLRAA
jgi:GDP-4-dehydro-6-deoxy-D-mannose reductase